MDALRYPSYQLRSSEVLSDAVIICERGNEKYKLVKMHMAQTI